MNKRLFMLIVGGITLSIIAAALGHRAQMWRRFVVPFKRRGKDAFGSGDFGASRVGHVHKGMDVLAAPGSPIYAPFSGTVRIGNAYTSGVGKDFFKLVEISGLAYKAKLMYVLPIVETGEKVKAGQVVGYAQNLDVRYPGMVNAGANHIHTEVWFSGMALNPDTFYPKTKGGILA